MFGIEEDEIKSRKPKFKISSILRLLFLAIIILIVAGKVLGYYPAKIVTGTMGPILPAGTIVIVKHGNNIKPSSDLIVKYELHGYCHLSRVVAYEGQEVYINDKEIRVDGKIVDPNNIAKPIVRTPKTIKVPKGSVFIVATHFTMFDSILNGPIGLDNIQGEVALRLTWLPDWIPGPDICL